jgi:hypothetical protein
LPYNFTLIQERQQGMKPVLEMLRLKIEFFIITKFLI